LYLLRDRGQVADLIQRAEAAGCRALMRTVDVPRMGRRLRDIRNGFALPPEITAANLRDDAATIVRRPSTGASGVSVHTNQVFEPSLSWADVSWLQERTRLPLVLKGILHPADAQRAAESGVSAVVVSNHGGRQLGGAGASIPPPPGVREGGGGRVGGGGRPVRGPARQRDPQRHRRAAGALARRRRRAARASRPVGSGQRRSTRGSAGPFAARRRADRGDDAGWLPGRRLGPAGAGHGISG